MKIKKLVAGILAGVIALSAVGISAFAVLSDDSSEWNGQPEVVQVNREPARATAYPYESEEKAQENGGEAEAFTDNVIMYEFLSELKDIAARPNGITCGCGSHDYSMEIRRDAVELTCRDCGARLRLSAATDRDLDDLCCHMKLVIPGGK